MSLFLVETVLNRLFTIHLNNFYGFRHLYFLNFSVLMMKSFKKEAKHDTEYTKRSRIDYVILMRPNFSKREKIVKFKHVAKSDFYYETNHYQTKK